MNREDLDKIAASTGIIFLSGMVLFQSCHRASTIYFFELQTTTVIFIEPVPALILPFALSILLWLAYKGIKRSASLEVERKAIMDKRKEIETYSLTNSRKTSKIESRKVSLTGLLSNIQEQDTIQSQHSQQTSLDTSEVGSRKTTEDNDVISFDAQSQQDRKPAGAACRFQSAPASTVPVEERSRSSTETDVCRKISGPISDLLELIITVSARTPNTLIAPEFLLGVNRKSSWADGGGRCYAGADEQEDSERERNAIYMQIGQTNLFTYSLSALNLLPKNRPGLPQLKLSLSDIMSEFFAVHLPVWVCVAAFYIVLLELFGVHFGTVTRDCRAPLMILIPRDHHGNKQSLAAINIIVPGIFLNVIQKYSSMYDPELFTVTYAAVFGALTITTVISVWRQKVMPGLVFPAIMAVIVSMGLCTHRNDLWRFMIKYKRTMPTRRI
ncbi:hypothetical protein DICVIV_06292 [Dictyocaulus viviparus]|uniref:Uncharacterized protein n=1 Tax=Dictyocaulus viviparus TaxID=29172 RepID=A0A0D8XSK6_DICVI|nr:hypothetical protein DICVIV_06292 [Dictyocaulus viviparus]